LRVRVAACCLVLSVTSAACSGGSTDGTSDPNGDGGDTTGRYRARIALAEFDEVPGPTIPAYAGTWELTLDEGARSYRIEAEGYGRVSGSYSFEGDTAVFEDTPTPEGAFNCFVDGERTFTEGRAEYLVEVEGDTVEFRVESEPCPLREAIMERAWTRL
jgi:hypothetical protein